MKTLLHLALALCLALVLSVTCAAAEAPEPLVIYDDGQPVACGVPLEGMERLLVILSVSGPWNSSDSLTVASGEYAGKIDSVFPLGNTGLSLMLLETRRLGATLGTDGGSVSDASLHLEGTTEEGYSIDVSCDLVESITLDGLSAYSLHSVPGLLPGTQLLNGDNEFAGLLVSTWAEGRGHYAALTAESVYSIVNGSFIQPPQPTQQLDPSLITQGVELTAEGQGYMTIDFSAAAVPGETEGSRFGVLVADPLNGFIQTFTLTADEPREIACAAVPGRSYMVLIYHIAQDKPDDWTPRGVGQESWLTCAVPEAAPMDRYSYSEVSAWLCVTPAGAEVGDTEELPKPEALDTADLFDTEAFTPYLQVTSAYDVAETHEEMLLFVLTAPDNSCYAQLGGFIFDQAYMPRDVWHADLSELFSECQSFASQTDGTYTLAWYMDGSLAGQLQFEHHGQ